MEFGIFLQGHVPLRRMQEDPDFEHAALVREVEIARAADRAGFKYVWASEHHFLDEYSHMSASEVFLAYLAGVTERIHLATGIRNLSPKVNPPVRVAEQAAMMDHLSGRRFELGTGRGAGHREVTGFDIPDTSVTKAWWDEVIRELPRMWRELEYHHDGEAFRTPPRTVNPKPWGHSHPPLWVAAGNPPTFEKAARLGLGVIGFSIGSVDDMAPLIETYKRHIGDADPVGEYVNDNAMVTNVLVCLEDGEKARHVATDMGVVRLHAGVYRYHTTMPRPDHVPRWPETYPEPGRDAVEAGIRGGYMLCGDPDEVTEQLRRFEASGADQVAFSLPIDMPMEVALESIRLFGEHVIPAFDEPEFRADRFRASAGVPPYESPVLHPVPETRDLP